MARNSKFSKFSKLSFHRLYIQATEQVSFSKASIYSQPTSLHTFKTKWYLFAPHHHHQRRMHAYIQIKRKHNIKFHVYIHSLFVCSCVHIIQHKRFQVSFSWNILCPLLSHELLCIYRLFPAFIASLFQLYCRANTTPSLHHTAPYNLFSCKTKTFWIMYWVSQSLWQWSWAQAQEMRILWH